MRKPDVAAISRMLRSDIAEYSLAEPENLRARSSWDRLADAEVTRPINGQDRSMKPGKPISQRKRSNRHHLKVLFLADTT